MNIWNKKKTKNNELYVPLAAPCVHNEMKKWGKKKQKMFSYGHELRPSSISWSSWNFSVAKLTSIPRRLNHRTSNFPSSKRLGDK